VTVSETVRRFAGTQYALPWSNRAAAPATAPAYYGANDLTVSSSIKARAVQYTAKLDEDFARWWRLSLSYLRYYSLEPGDTWFNLPSTQSGWRLLRRVDATALNNIFAINPTTVLTVCLHQRHSRQTCLSRMEETYMSTKAALFTSLGSESAPEQARPILEKVQKGFHFIPNLYGTFANSPALLEAYTAVDAAFEKSRLCSTERQLVLLAASVENACQYCTAAHSTVLKQVLRVPPEVVAAVRSGSPVSDHKLNAGPPRRSGICAPPARKSTSISCPWMGPCAARPAVRAGARSAPSSTPVRAPSSRSARSPRSSHACWGFTRLGSFIDAQGIGGAQIYRNRLRLREGPGAIDFEHLAGLAAGVHASLLDSHPESVTDRAPVRVFAEWPKDWDAAFTLLARGGFLVSAAQQAGSIRLIEVLSQYGGELRLANPWGEGGIAIYRNGRKAEDAAGAVVTMPTAKGKTIVVVPRGATPAVMRML
jgi:hypothetical protein